MSEKFLVYDERHLPFDAHIVEQAFRLVKGISLIRTSPAVVAAVEAEYESLAGKCIVRLISTCKAIVIEGSREAVAEATFETKCALNQSLHLIDEEYTFDLPLSNMTSPQVILRNLEASIEE